MCRTCPVRSLVIPGWTPQRDMLLFVAFLLGIHSVIQKLDIVSFVLTGFVEAAAGPYLGFSIQDLSLDEKAEFLLVAQGGKILHIDFGDCFEASMNREKFPEKFLFIKFGVCQPAVPPQEQPNDDDHDDGGIDSIDTS
ncbi:hypothetical protein ACLB2K_013312 [Fragaria x ananassa]